ncbi:MAG: transglycosylase domain-containing protein, partial [Candidatus Paceibacterota bacterium]
MRINKKTKGLLLNGLKILLVFAILIAGGAFIWVSTFDIPDLDAFTNRQVQQSTKIYDRTGEIVLYDLNKDVRRTRVSLEEISPNLLKATVAIEDAEFYNHNGIRISSIIRASWANLKSFGFQQGGSTITQQVVKNTLLTPKKTISRKLKEWILALRLDHELDKDTILEIYLNETPYGGRVYGAEEAADRYFGKSAIDLSIAESAYIAALPQAPTYYWNNREDLSRRQREVLLKMYENDFITETEYEQARVEEVVFLSGKELSIRAPHFVFYIRQYLEEIYGTTAIERQGLKVVTTLDYELQQKAEEILARYGEQNAQRFNATNASLVAVDPRNGHILAMVGSRDYSNEEIQGNFNAATSARQPGSSFKPFVYATALNKGYTDSTVIFDLPTQFSVNCSSSNFTSDDGCFSPGNYDEKFRGPISFRNALAQSVNVPAVKVFYLAGMEDSLDTARSMGISTLNKKTDRYGLSLVLGSGEVTLLDLTSAYGVFANEGVKNSHTGILRIEDVEGEILEEFKEVPERVLATETARMITNILSDNVARTPSFGPNSPLFFPDYDVAAKTGTTNNYLDLWTVGYNPNIAVG